MKKKTKMNLDFVSCDICDVNDTSLFSIMPTDMGWEFEPKSFSYVRCNKCDLLYINPRPKPEQLFEYYNEETVQKNESVDGHVSSYFHNYNRGKKYHIEIALEELKKIKKYKKTGKLLEIGCASGFFLNEAKKQGYDVYGIEPSENFAEYAKNKLGLKVVLGVLEENTFDDNFFDVIVHFDLISHLTSPKQTFKIINKIMKSGGLHYFRTGNKAELLTKEQGEIGEVWGVPEHLYHFSRKNVNILLDNTGFETKKIITSANLLKILSYRKKNSSAPKEVKSAKTITSVQKKSLAKTILHNPIIFPLYRYLMGNRILWEKLGTLASFLIRPISANIWIFSIKR